MWKALTSSYPQRRAVFSLLSQQKSSPRKRVVTHPPSNRSFRTTAAQRAPDVATSVSSPGRLRRWWYDGTILLTIGWTAFGLVVVDRGLQYLDSSNVEQVIDMVEDETKQKRQELLAKFWDAPTLYRSTVKIGFKLEGSHGLKYVEVEDVVDVIEEEVGPGNYYNLCRTKDPNGDVKSIGWYPVSYLQKIEPEPEKKD
jgi:hypothetical protein